MTFKGREEIGNQPLHYKTSGATSVLLLRVLHQICNWPHLVRQQQRVLLLLILHSTFNSIAFWWISINGVINWSSGSSWEWGTPTHTVETTAQVLFVLKWRCAVENYSTTFWDFWHLIYRVFFFTGTPPKSSKCKKKRKKSSKYKKLS